MMSSLIESLFKFLEATSSRKKNWQIASAVALGILCGLLPYTSLLPALVLTLAFFIPFHVSVFGLTAIITAACSFQAEYLCAIVGEWSLSSPLILEPILRFNQVPLAAWLQLNNTVVHGALVIGLLQLAPTYLTIQILCFLFRPSRVRLDQDYQTEIAPEISYVDIGPEVFQEVQESKPDFSLEHPTEGSNRSELENETEHQLVVPPESGTPDTSITRVESFLADVRNGKESTDTKSIAERASELAELVDEMLDDLQESESNSDDPGKIAKQHAPHDSPLEAKSKRFTSRETDNAEMTPKQTGSFVKDDSSSKLQRTDSAHAEGGTVTKEDASRQASQHEEALRYLLHHLKEIKDKA